MIEGTKDDNGKLKLSRVPPELIEAVVRVRDVGDRKYTDPENWKHIAPERWHEALLRHVLAECRATKYGYQYYKYVCVPEKEQERKRTGRRLD